MKRKMITASLVAGTMLFTACGGGGASGGGTTTSDEVQMSGLVVDGYISGSTVCIEGMDPAVCTTTDSSGKYTFPKIKASKLPSPVKIVATGGLSHVLKPLNPLFDHIDRHLTLNGIEAYYDIVVGTKAD